MVRKTSKIHLLFCWLSTYLFLLLLTLIWTMPLFATELDTYPIYLRLRFDKDSNLWERKVLPEDSCWAEQCHDGEDWKQVPELPRRVKVGVALAGGVVRGIAHIGVLRVLEENNIPIDGIAGTSMGAIIGGLYACGYSTDALELVVKDSIDWKSIFSDQPPRQYFPIWERLREKPRLSGLDFSVTGKFWPPVTPEIGVGLRTAQRFTNEIAKRTLEQEYRAGFDFDSLCIPYGVMLTNLIAGKPKLMRKGTVSTASRASGSVPIVFEPMKIDGIQYVDGGVLDNLPVDAFKLFDKTRAPDNMMNVIGNDTIDYYVIAVYPSKRRGDRDSLVESPEFKAPLGIDVMNRSATLAREKHVWNSWDSADARIDVDIEGGFDFTPKKLEEVIDDGYKAASLVKDKDAGEEEIYRIKRAIAGKEDNLEFHEQTKRLHKLLSISVYSIKDNDTTEVENNGKNNEGEIIFDAIKLEERASDTTMKYIKYVEKIDVCEAIKRIHDHGDFEDINAKIEENDGEWALTFFVKQKEIYKDSLEVVLKMNCLSAVSDSTIKEVTEIVQKAVEERISKKKRVLNFCEVEETVESNLVAQGFIAPRVNKVSMEGDTLYVYGNMGEYLIGVTIRGKFKKDEIEKIKKEFRKPLNPRNVLNSSKYIFKEFQLKSISIEDKEGDSLVIAAEKKSAYILEFPSFTLENHEGPSLFGEARSRRWNVWSPYINYTRNFPLKESLELPKGRRIAAGFQRSGSIFPFSKSNLIPEVNVYWRKLLYPSKPESLTYDGVFNEINSQFTLPVYLSDYAFVPGIEISWIDTSGIWSKPCYGGVFWLRYDDLNRITFPDSGWKADIDTKVGFEPYSWSRIRFRLLIPKRFNFLNIATPTVMGRMFVSWFDKDTPEHEKYSLGGFTPVGGYQVRLYDYEDLPGFKRNEFKEPIMWKAGGSVRVAPMEMSLLGVHVNLLLEGYLNFAESVPSGEKPLSRKRINICPALGLYLDTSYFNVGILANRKTHGKEGENWWSSTLHHFHIFAVHYSFGF